MTCQTPYAMEVPLQAGRSQGISHASSVPEAGRQYHFTCTGRDVFGNINRDHELKLTSFFNYVAVTCPKW